MITSKGLRKAGHWWRNWGEETFSAYLFLLPTLIVFAVFVFFPLFFSFYASLTNWNLPFKPSFSGLENYRYLFTDEIGSRDFFMAIRNSFYYALGFCSTWPSRWQWVSSSTSGCGG